MIKIAFILFFVLSLSNCEEVEFKLDQVDKLPLIREKRQFGYGHGGFGHGMMGHPFGMGHGMYGHQGYPYGGGCHGNHCGGWYGDDFGDDYDYDGGYYRSGRSNNGMQGLHGGGLTDGIMNPGMMNPLSMIGGLLGAGRSATKFQKELIPPLTQDSHQDYYVPAHDADNIYQQGYPFMIDHSGRAAVPYYVMSSPYRYQPQNIHYNYDYPPCS